MLTRSNNPPKRLRLTAIFLFIFAVLNFSNDPASADETKTNLANKDHQLHYFHTSYDQSFEHLNRITDSLYTLRPTPIRTDLIIDNDDRIQTIYFPPKSKPSHIIVFTSGTHGIEGFTGSAVQLFLMDQLIPRLRRENLGVLMIHGLNPWGFKNRRRVTKNNVDLNRNFMIDSKDFSTNNQSYKNLTAFLNPKTPVSRRFLDRAWFYIQSGYYLFRYSMHSLRQSILEGQYEIPKGIYYGGNSYEPQVEIIEREIDKITAPYSRILFIDLHTGYGKNGELHLFPDQIDDQPTKELLTDIFRGSVIDFGDTKDFYSVKGGYVNYFYQRYRTKKTFIPMVFEYGTSDSQEIFGALFSLRTMILENQGFQNGYSTLADQKKTWENFDRLFYPSDPEWRKQTLRETEKILEKSITRFMKI